MAEITKPNFSNALWASGGSIVAPSDVKIATGWTAEVPPFQWENYSQNRQDQGIAHILQHGISVWDTLTEYQAGKSYVQGSDGLIYKAIQTNTGQNPVTDTTFVYWSKAVSGGLLAVRVLSTVGVSSYTPTPGTKTIIVEAQGAGASAGGVQTTTASQVGASAGAYSGAYGKSIYQVSALSLPVSCTIGAGGLPAAAGGNPGNSGGTTSFGPYLSCPGGTASVGVAAGSAPQVSVSGAYGATPTGANIISMPGKTGSNAVMISLSSGFSGAGGDSMFGVGGYSRALTSASGVTGVGYGAGGGGALASPSSAGLQGGAGVQGVIIVWEYT